MKTDSGPTRLEDYRPPDYLIDRVDLDFRLDPTATRLTAKLSVRVRESIDAPLVLVGDELKLISLEIDGRTADEDAFAATPEQLVVHRPPQGPFTLTIETEIDPSANSELMGLFVSNGTYCTQCEPEGFRRMTYFLDRPDVLSVYTARVEADQEAAPVLLSNGNLTECGSLNGGRHFAVWHDPFPKPSYLFALVAGDLGAIEDKFTTRSGRKVKLAIYCEHGNQDRCRYAMDSLKRAMRWDEEVFGLEYDLDVFNIVAVSDFNMGAMENKGLNIFNDRFILADAATATDTDYNRIEGVVAHEYFHNWTGNRITCRDWFQLCLKEGLTVYRDQEFSADMLSRPVKRIEDVRTLKARQFPEDGGPLAHPVRPEIYHEINNFYTATVYEKGAEIVRMLAALMGQNGFRKGMDLYFRRHDGEAATVEDFVASFADANDIDLTQFKHWYAQSGTPEVVAKGRYDAAARRYSLSLAQSTPATPGQSSKKPLHIPIRFGLVGSNGGDLEYQAVRGADVTEGVIHLTGAHQDVVFEGVTEKPVPSLLRGFSAPVRMQVELSTDELTFLLRTDADPFNRWQAAQSLLMAELIVGTKSIRAGSAPAPDRLLVEAIGEAAGNAALDPALRAQILMLPSESEIAREIGRDVDPDAIGASHAALRAAIGQQLSDLLNDLYRELANSGPYDPGSESQGRRALRNTALDLLVAADVEANASRAFTQFAAADNMTDRMAALVALNTTAAPERDAAMTAFRKRFESDPLTLDKWLALEATAPRPDTALRVRELEAEPAFSINNPNRVRALIGSFAGGNQTQFNRADGSGYDLVADVVLRLDRQNPQMAARLLVAFRSWRALEESRRAAAEIALRRIAETDPLSADVRDIITRILA